MKINIIQCDLCGLTIKENPFILRPQSNRMKQIGHDVVLTPRGNRIQGIGTVMLRMNVSLYCGTSADEELHFHQSCIDEEAKERTQNYLQNGARHV